MGQRFTYCLISLSRQSFKVVLVLFLVMVFGWDLAGKKFLARLYLKNCKLIVVRDIGCVGVQMVCFDLI